MSKKHFTALAAEIRKMENTDYRLAAAAAVAAASRQFNPMFDAQKFYEACGVTA